MDIEEIKRKKLEQLKRQVQQNQDEELQEQINIQHQINQMWDIIKNYLTKEAITRYSSLKIAHPETATKLLVSVYQAIQKGYITEKIDDNKLKEILREIQGHKKDFRILSK